jgi:F-type H+-transporting ATPase subunit delta
VIQTTLAGRYAQALVEIGQERRALDKYGSDLTSFGNLVAESHDFREVLSNPAFTREDRKVIATTVLRDLDADPIMINFVCVLIDRKRIDQLAGIETAFRQKVDELHGIKRGEIISAKPLAKEDLSRVTEVLARISGKKVLVTPAVDPSLIGGVVAKVGDMVLDGTLRTQLNQLKESLKG